MQAIPQTPRVKEKSAVALLLTFAAGLVDVVGYLTLYHSFVAHMTGTTVHLGHQLVIGDWTQAAKAGTVIASFVSGSVVGRAIIELGVRCHKRKVATVSLVFEAALVLAVIETYPWLLGRTNDQTLWKVCVLLAMLAGAMGLQTATLTRIGPLTVHTTFVTGMLNKLAQALSQWFFWIHDQHKERAALMLILRSSPQHTAFQNAVFMSAIWLSYIVGSVIGTFMDAQWRMAALYLPVLILLISAATDQARPLSIEEEKEQAQQDL